MTEDADWDGDRIHVVGAGLLGTSIGLALARVGVEVWLSDRSQDNVRTAAGLGAGVPAPQGMTAPVVVVAVPPSAIAAGVARSLAAGSLVTDVGSVKWPLVERIGRLVGPEALTRYVGSHPMAGSERSGPLAASAALFDGRPWAITPHAHVLGPGGGRHRAARGRVWRRDRPDHARATTTARSPSPPTCRT